MQSFDELLGMAAPSRVVNAQTAAKSGQQPVTATSDPRGSFSDILRSTSASGSELPSDGKMLPQHMGEGLERSLSTPSEFGPKGDAAGEVAIAPMSSEPRSNELVLQGVARDSVSVTVEPTENVPLRSLVSLTTSNSSASLRVSFAPAIGESQNSSLEDNELKAESGRANSVGLTTPSTTESGAEHTLALSALESGAVVHGAMSASAAGTANTSEKEVSAGTAAGAETTESDRATAPPMLSLDASDIEAAQLGVEPLYGYLTPPAEPPAETLTVTDLARDMSSWALEPTLPNSRPLAEAVALAMKVRSVSGDSPIAMSLSPQTDLKVTGDPITHTALATVRESTTISPVTAAQAAVLPLTVSAVRTSEGVPAPIAERLGAPPNPSVSVLDNGPSAESRVSTINGNGNSANSYTSASPGLENHNGAFRLDESAASRLRAGGTTARSINDPTAQPSSTQSAEVIQSSIRSVSDPSSAYIVRAYAPAVSATPGSPVAQRLDNRLVSSTAIASTSTFDTDGSRQTTSGVIDLTFGSPLQGAAEESVSDRASGASFSPSSQQTIGSASLTVTGQQAPSAGPLSEAQLPVGLLQRLAQAAAQGQKSFRVALSPATLGNLDVSIEIRNEQTTVVAVASSPAAKEALEASMPRLRQLLEGSDLQLESFTVAEESGQNSRGYDSREGGSQEVVPGGRVVDTEQANPDHRIEVSVDLDGVDLFA